VYSLLISPTTGKVFLSGEIQRVYDPETGKSSRLRMNGRLDTHSHKPAWSPDGRYIAYAAVISPYTRWIGNVPPDSIRVIALDGRETTVARDMDSTVEWEGLLWLPDQTTALCILRERRNARCAMPE
jgi:hypothetical protein